jgi:hypothetical protein
LDDWKRHGGSNCRIGWIGTRYCLIGHALCCFCLIVEGMLLWGLSSMIVGWMVGVFGLFSWIGPRKVATPALNYAGKTRLLRSIQR